MGGFSEVKKKKKRAQRREVLITGIEFNCQAAEAS